MSPSLKKPSIDCNRKAGWILPLGSALLHSSHFTEQKSSFLLSTPHFRFFEDDEHFIHNHSFASFEGCGLTERSSRKPWSHGGWDVEEDRPGFKFYTWPLPMWNWIGYSTLQSVLKALFIQAQVSFVTVFALLMDMSFPHAVFSEQPPPNLQISCSSNLGLWKRWQ